MYSNRCLSASRSVRNSSQTVSTTRPRYGCVQSLITAYTFPLLPLLFLLHRDFVSSMSFKVSRNLSKQLRITMTANKSVITVTATQSPYKSCDMVVIHREILFTILGLSTNRTSAPLEPKYLLVIQDRDSIDPLEILVTFLSLGLSHRGSMYLQSGRLHRSASHTLLREFELQRPHQSHQGGRS